MTSNQKVSGDDTLDNVKVGHAGLYVPDDADTVDEAAAKVANTLGVISEVITADIPLGIEKGGKTLIDCEQGIKAFVRDQLAGTKDNPVDNHLPNTETGVWIYYLTKGIEKDFGRSWEKTPKSLIEKVQGVKKKGGKRVITKREKNELLLKKDMGYWLPMVSAGKITIEDAAKEVAKAAQEILNLEKEGIYLNENKTAGVKDYNIDRTIIDEWDGNWEALDILKKHGIVISIPDIADTIFSKESKRPKVKYFSIIKNVSQLLPAVAWIGQQHKMKDALDGYEEKEINSIDDIWDLVPSFYKHITTDKHEGTTIKGLHIGKTKATGKDTCIIADTLNIKTKDRVIHVLDANDGMTTIYDDIWYNKEEEDA